MPTEIANFHPEKIEKYVPIKWVKQEVTRKHVTTKVNEFRTSLVCPDCDSQFYTVAEYRKDRFYQARCLKWCYDCLCREMPLKHCDVVEAKMIFRRDGPAIMKALNYYLLGDASLT